MQPLNPKVKAGVGGGITAGVLGTCVAWGAQQAGLEMDAVVAVAFGSLFYGLGSFVAGYLKPPQG